MALGTVGVMAGTAAAAPSADVKTASNAKSKCYDNTESASVAVYVLNTDRSPIDVRVTTPFGEKKISKIEPGKAFYNEFGTGKGKIAAGQATVAAYRWDGGLNRGFYASFSVSYGAVSCTLNPRIEAKAVDTDRDRKINEVTVKNTGAHRISVRVTIPGGVNQAQDLEPGKTITVKNRNDNIVAGLVTAYKFIDGKGYFTAVPVSTLAPRSNRMH
ncbi:hypothetical protein [Pseudonocardia yunnanensis]|uniref:Uncharacterized protein n=1 Tax=Pseudonocardia yunnanensis TaxID=58107 RepID=A0ABW4EY40_9PSEU